ncbi:hypothetical protein KI387_023689, partial [Taxus chinensis]
SRGGRSGGRLDVPGKFPGTLGTSRRPREVPGDARSPSRPQRPRDVFHLPQPSPGRFAHSRQKRKRGGNVSPTSPRPQGVRDVPD